MHLHNCNNKQITQCLYGVFNTFFATAGITAQLQEQLVHGRSTAEDHGPVPQQSTPDFRQHEAP